MSKRSSRQARFVLVRLLGGLDYWRYGVDEFAARRAARRRRAGHRARRRMEDPRLDDASTAAARPICARIWACFQQGGAGNIAAVLDFIAAQHRRASVAGRRRRTSRGRRPFRGGAAAPGARARALIVFYRSVYARRRRGAG